MNIHLHMGKLLVFLTLGLCYCTSFNKANASPNAQEFNNQQAIIEPPTILVHPILQLYQDASSPANFSVVATGSDLTYQWQLNDVNIYGATSSTYTIKYLDGFIYQGKRLRVIVSNSAGSVISKSIFISIWNFDPVPTQLVMPLYNCQTGAITFQTINPPRFLAYYGAIGIGGFSANPNQTVEAELRADPKPIQLVGYVDGIYGLMYRFDLAAACQVKANNQAPVTYGLRSQRIQQGRESTIIIPYYAFSDPENQPMYYTASGLPSGLTLAGNTIVGLTDKVGIFPVTIKATDPGGLSTQATFLLTVSPAPTSMPLRILPPVYNCQTGKLTFLTCE